MYFYFTESKEGGLEMGGEKKLERKSRLPLKIGYLFKFGFNTANSAAYSSPRYKI